MKDEVEIRFTIKEDLEQLPWLYRQYHNGDSKLETDVNGMYKEFDKLSSNQDYKFVSAVIEDKLVGFCSVVVNHEIVEEQRPLLMLWDLRVHPDYRNRKIGSSIMKFIEEYGKSINALLIFLGCDNDNIKAKNFYHKLGYGEVFAFYKYL